MARQSFCLHQTCKDMQFDKPLSGMLQSKQKNEVRSGDALYLVFALFL